MKKELTLTQKRVLIFMRDFFKENHQLPPAQQIADYFGCYPNAACEFQKQLEKRGYIEKNVVGKYKFSK